MNQAMNQAMDPNPRQSVPATVPRERPLASADLPTPGA
jgi:hypothetical protein